MGANNPGYSAAHSAADSNMVDDATLKRTARAFVKVRHIAQNEQSAVDNTPAVTEKRS